MKDVSWIKLEEAKKSGEAVPVFGKGVSTPGFVVDALGIEGFIPTSQLGKEITGNAQNLVGKYFKARVMEVDKMNKKIVLSEKEVSEAGNIALVKEALEKIKEGEIYDGVVTTVAPFGAFVKIGVPVKKEKAEVEGLVHVSELSFSRRFWRPMKASWPFPLSRPKRILGKVLRRNLNPRIKLRERLSESVILAHLLNSNPVLKA
jgi:ribosomal protein S1